MAGIATNSQGVAPLTGQQHLSPLPSSSTSPSPRSQKQRTLRPRALKTLDNPSRSFITIQKAVKGATKEIKNSLYKELLSTLQPIIQNTIQEVLQEPLKEITNLLLKGGIESMNNSNSIQELIRQGLYNLENTLKKSIATKESKKGKEKEPSATPQPQKNPLSQREQEQEPTPTPLELGQKSPSSLGVPNVLATTLASTLSKPKPTRPTSTTS